MSEEDLIADKISDRRLGCRIRLVCFREQTDTKVRSRSRSWTSQAFRISVQCSGHVRGIRNFIDTYAESPEFAE